MEPPTPPPALPAAPRRRRGDGWTLAFDETLAALSAQLPLGDLLARILEIAAETLDAPHGVLVLAPGGQALARVGHGAWTLAAPGVLAADAGVLCVDPAAGAGAMIAVPVRAGAGAVGWLALGRDAGVLHGFSAEARELLARFARLATLAYENERLVATERAARQQEQAVRAATLALTAKLELTDVLAAILDELQNVVPHDTASVQELQGDRMVVVGGRGIDLRVFLGLGFDALGDGVPNSDVRRLRRPVIVADILGEHPYPEFPHAAHALSGVRCWLGVPLLYGDRCTGMLTLDKREPGFYTEAHAQTALAFAAQAAIALENARRFESSQRQVAERRRAEEELRRANQRLQDQIAEIEELQARLREQAIRDPLTMLFNRRYFSETLPRELARCQREGRPLSVCLLDLDHFKDLNDAFGHEAGDQALAAFGAFLLERTRDADIACRYGGEEFIVMMPGAAGQVASARADEWRRALGELRIRHAGRELTLTTSIGVAESAGDSHSPDDLIRAADVALYQAKREGRNRVVLAR